MFKKYKFLGALIFCFVFIGFIWAIKSPLIFKYSESFVFVDNLELEELVSINTSMSEDDLLNLNQLAFNIPMPSNSFGQSLYNMSFEDKFQQSIEEGKGNCSNQVLSISWYLLTKLDTYNFNIVYLYSKKSFTKGLGHSVLDAEGIYDIYEGGIWTQGDGRIVKLEDILSISSLSNQQELQLKNLNPSKINKLENYVEKLLESSFVGVTHAKSFDQYIRFIDLIYFPFKDKRIEKYFYDGMALLFGKLPVIYIKGKREEIIPDYILQFKLAKIWILSVRVIMMLSILLILKKCIGFLKKRNRNYAHS